MNQLRNGMTALGGAARSSEGSTEESPPTIIILLKDRGWMGRAGVAS